MVRDWIGGLRSSIQIEKIQIEKELDSVSNLIYKFLPPEIAFKVLEEKKLKVSLIPELNDVYDYAPILRQIQGEDADLPRSQLEFVFRQNILSYGLICFSKNYRSPLQWGHYAAGATGLALGFDPGRKISHTDWKEPIEVKYEKNRPIIEWPPNRDVTTDDEMRSLIRSSSVKATEWSYEDEVRYVLSLADCEPRTGMYFAEFYPVALRQVILGCRHQVRPSYVDHVLKRHFVKEVSLYVADVHPELYEIRLLRFPELCPDPEPG